MTKVCRKKSCSEPASRIEIPAPPTCNSDVCEEVLDLNCIRHFENEELIIGNSNPSTSEIILFLRTLIDEYPGLSLTDTNTVNQTLEDVLLMGVFRGSNVSEDSTGLSFVLTELIILEIVTVIGNNPDLTERFENIVKLILADCAIDGTASVVTPETPSTTVEPTTTTVEPTTTTVEPTTTTVAPLDCELQGTISIVTPTTTVAPTTTTVYVPNCELTGTALFIDCTTEGEGVIIA